MLAIFLLLSVVMLFVWLMKYQKKLGIKWQEAGVLSICHIIVGLMCAKFWALLEVGFRLEEAAPLRLYGPVFIMPVLYYLYAKFTNRNLPLMMDVITINIIIGLVGGRLNCFYAGCCTGALILPNGTMRWPLRELEMAFYIIFAACYCGKILRNRTRGEVFSVYLMCYGALRFVCEFAREEYTGSVGFVHFAHIWSLIAIAVGAVMYIKTRRNNQFGGDRRKKSQSNRLAKGG